MDTSSPSKHLKTQVLARVQGTTFSLARIGRRLDLNSLTQPENSSEDFMDFFNSYRLELRGGRTAARRNSGRVLLREPTGRVMAAETHVFWEVVSHFTVGDALSYDNIVFVIDVTSVPHSVSYTVERSYVDWVDLDRRLRKKFPRTQLPRLPLVSRLLVEKELVHKQKQSVLGGANFRNNSTDEPYGFAAAGAARTQTVAEFSIPTSTARESHLNSRDSIESLEGAFSHDAQFEYENMGAKVDELNMYFLALLNLPEVVVSSEVALFLDEEAANLRSDISKLAPLSVYDILLAGSSTARVLVRSSETLCLRKVLRDQLVVWRFRTRDFDIGFSVDLNDECRVAYTRCPSHLEPSAGSLQAHENGTVNLKWDNSYSALRSKRLSYSCRIVSLTEYAAAKEKALICQRDKKRLQQQRNALKVCLSKHASGISSGSVTLASTIVQEEEVEERDYVERLEEQIAALNASLAEAIESSGSACEEIEALSRDKTLAEQSRDQMSSSWRYTVSELEKVKAEAEALRNERDDWLEERRQLKSQAAALRVIADSCSKRRLSGPPATAPQPESSAESSAAAEDQRDKLKQDLIERRAADRLVAEQEIACLRLRHQEEVSALREALRRREAEVEELAAQLKERVAEQQALASLRGQIKAISEGI